MVEIISRRDGPRREDSEIGRLISQNRDTITKLADVISSGRFSASKQPISTPQAEGLIFHFVGSPGETQAIVAEPEIRVAVNGRVIAVDAASRRQLCHFGDIRDVGGMKVFRLATAENGFIAPLDDDRKQALADLDGVTVGASYDDAALVADIARRLDIPSG